MKKMKRILNNSGNSTPFTIAMILGLLIIICTMAEFFRLVIIVSGVRDGLQQAVLSVATTNYDETYNGLREGYSGGYILNGERWVENMDSGDIYTQLDELLETVKSGDYHVKGQGDGYEYRLSSLVLELENPQLAPEDTADNFTAVARITIEVPLSFGWQAIPPLTLEIRTSAEYMPKF